MRQSRRCPAAQQRAAQCGAECQQVNRQPHESQVQDDLKISAMRVRDSRTDHGGRGSDVLRRPKTAVAKADENPVVNQAKQVLPQGNAASERDRVIGTIDEYDSPQGARNVHSIYARGQDCSTDEPRCGKSKDQKLSRGKPIAPMTAQPARKARVAVRDFVSKRKTKAIAAHAESARRAAPGRSIRHSAARQIAAQYDACRFGCTCPVKR